MNRKKILVIGASIITVILVIAAFIFSAVEDYCLRVQCFSLMR